MRPLRPKRKTAGLGSNGGLSKPNSALNKAENAIRVKFEPNNSAVNRVALSRPLEKGGASWN